jgi:PAS domain S-box-containing protein
MSTQPILGVAGDHPTAMPLPRTLSVLETWGFGLTGHLSWLFSVPTIAVALGPSAIFVFLPAVIVGMLLNFQVKHLGERWPDIAGGTPNYTARLLKNYPGLGRYAAIGYWSAWTAFLPINAIGLTELIKANLETMGIACPETILKIGFTVIPFILAFSGTRALAILHLFFILPAIAFLFTYCLQGLGWLAFSPASPGFFPSEPTSSVASFQIKDWLQWFFFALWATCGCESASSFVADSRRPGETLRFLTFAAWLIPVLYLGGTWVLIRLATESEISDNPFAILLAAAKPFWGTSASFLVTLLISSGCLLGCATVVSNTPRILYQLAKDGQMSPVFAVLSRRGVLGPSLVFGLLLSLVCLIWGDITRIVLVTGTGGFACTLILFLGLWLRRSRPTAGWRNWREAVTSWCWLGLFVVEAVVLVVAGLAISWQDILLGLLLPVALLGVDAAIRRIPFAPFHPNWWIKRDQIKPQGHFKDFVAVQVLVLLFLVCGAASASWFIKARLDGNVAAASNDLFIIFLMMIAFVGIAIACWTSLPQVAAIAEAREIAESRFITALDTVPDTVLVIDSNGALRQANPAAEQLFDLKTIELIDRPLNRFFPQLPLTPDLWPNRNEQTLDCGNRGLRFIEFTISQRANRDLSEYIVILRDITDRKLSEAALRNSEETARQQATQLELTLQDLRRTQAQLIQTEKMSSLGQLVAGVAHEINNPVNFIYGNLAHVSEYTEDFLSLIHLYQQGYRHSDPEIQTLIEEIDLNYLVEDLPKMVSSMKVGANRIREIVLTLRNFSRLDEAEMKRVNIHEGLESTLLILQGRFKAKPELPAITMIKNYDDLPLVECYAGQLNQVFMNILSNAIDALHKSDRERTIQQIQEQPSSITIQTRLLANNCVGISFKDNGPGISEMVRKRIFDPFFTTKPVGEGTGLGLSISYQIIVDKHGGRLECVSEPGGGAEFIIEIPLTQQRKQREN